MHLSPTAEHQADMRLAYYDGAPGVLVSSLIWLTAAAVCQFVGVHKAVWALLIGGALIHPLSLVLTKLLGRSAKTQPGNALAQLAAASTVWLIVCCAFAYGLYLLKPAFFFPAMMAVIGCRYMVFASVFGRAIFWLLGGVLVAAGNFSFLLAAAPALAAAVGGAIELVFAAWMFAKAERVNTRA
jgi:hypothetical protein